MLCKVLAHLHVKMLCLCLICSLICIGTLFKQPRKTEYSVLGKE